MTTTYIYALKDPRDGSLRYVGITSRPRIRLGQHVRNRPEPNQDKRAWIAELVNDGLRPEMIILEVTRTRGRKAEEIERLWIDKLAKEGEPLTNICRYAPKRGEGLEIGAGDLFTVKVEA